MSALPRPDLPPGPHRRLVDDLHELHRHDGWRSLRVLARETGVSHTTVSKVFSSLTLPSWGTVELLVEAMGGDTGRFHELWLDASAPGRDDRDQGMRIAGRRSELDVVRRHLESGRGLLLVTGEAGMGKTTVVEAACAELRDTVLIAAGRCLPLSTEVPLLPVADALHHLARAEDGRPASDALQACPAYVRDAVSVLVPEWSTSDTALADPDDRWLRQRLFSGLAELCRAVSASRHFAVVLEDLHWADALTLDLVEHLVLHADVRVLGSWRTDDPEVSGQHQEWFSRVRRDADALPLEALSAAETWEQVRILRPEATADDAARIHGRSRGQPLFTEQLAQADAGHPTYLGDLLDRRVARLTGQEWAIASVLGVADRPLSEADVVAAAGASEVGFPEVLRALQAQKLVEVSPGGVNLRHPLLAEAVRRRLLPGEAAAVHRVVASVLSSGTEAEPAEVARHWQGAGEPDEERAWQVRAARAASERYAGMQAADHWRRALALWPSGAAEAGDPPVRRHEVVTGIATQLDLAGRPRDAVPVLEAELALPDPPDLYGVAERADLLRQLARLNSSQFLGGSLGLQLVEQAIDLYRTLAPSSGLAMALTWKGTELEWGGRRSEATDVLAEAAEVAGGTGDRLLERTVLSQWAWQLAASGDGGSVDEIERIIREFGQDASPLRNLWVAVRHSDILLMACRPAEDVERAARPALDQAASWTIAGGHADILKSNVAQAWRRAGRVGRAMEVVSAETEMEQPQTSAFLHVDRAILEVLQGHGDVARRRVGHLDASGHEVVDTFKLEAHLHHAIWMGEPGQALDLAKVVLAPRHDQVPPGTAGDLLLLTAEAAADAYALSTPEDRLHVRRTLDRLRAAMHHDPFAPDAVLADRACLPQWEAETRRLLGVDAIEDWLQASRTWQRITRPHEAAYCLWRAAQVSLREERGTVAGGLLRQAARSAREHVPLSRAVAATAAALGT